jgi:hypothetical protein
MNPKLLELATRRGGLQARIDEQRRTLGRNTQPLESVFAKGDAVLEGVGWLKQHPGAVAAVVAVAAILRPKRAWRWGRRGFFVWQGWQAIRKKLQISG